MADETSKSDSSWLEQYYTASKTHDPGLESTDPAYSPAAHIAATEKYAVGTEVGRGGMKSVRRAHDQNANRDVAMAVLQDGKIEPRFIRRFVREARVTAALEHPNIVPVHDIGVGVDGRPYFTMKLLGGESLHGILQKIDAGETDYRRRYTLSRLLQIFLGAGNAVAFAHSRGVIHLDLKPSNIQVGDFGEVLVLDWGLAKIMDRAGALELPEELRVVHTEGVARGTPGFMSPEQTRGEYSKLDERTDVFALGAVLATVLTGRMPGQGPLNDRRIPVALQQVALRALAADPAARYQSVRELLRDVQAFLAGYATSAQQASTFTVLWLLIKRQKVAATLVAVSLAVILAISVVAFVRITRSERVALQALEKIEQEQAANRKLGLLAAPRVLQQANDALRAYDLDAGEQQLDFALGLDGRQAPGWSYKACLHLGRWEFAEAVTAFDRAERLTGRKPPREDKPPDQIKTLRDLAVKYRHTGAPTGLQFVLDVQRLGKSSPEWRQLTLAEFFHERNRTAADFGLVADALRVLNPATTEVKLDYEFTDGWELRLAGENLGQLLPLVGLPVIALDLTGCAPTELAPLSVIVPLLSTMTSPP